MLSWRQPNSSIRETEDEEVENTTGANRRRIVQSRTSSAVRINRRITPHNPLIRQPVIQKYPPICTHFLSIPFNTKEILGNYEKFKEQVLDLDSNRIKIDKMLLQHSYRLHYTFNIEFLLDTEQKIQHALEVLASCERDIIKPFIKKHGTMTMTMSDVYTCNFMPNEMNKMYCKVSGGTGLGRLQALVDKIKQYFDTKGFQLSYINNPKVNIPIMSSSFRKRRTADEDKRSGEDYTERYRFNGTEILQKHGSFYFGQQQLERIYFCIPKKYDDNDYYNYIGSMDCTAAQ